MYTFAISIQQSTGSSSQCSSSKARKRNKKYPTGKEVKLFWFTDDVTLYVGVKILQIRLYKFSKLARYKDSCISIYYNQQHEKENMKIISLKIASKKKNLGINLTNEVNYLYHENNRALLRK